MSHEPLPLFAWQPPRRVIMFPLAYRKGKVRHTALKLVGKRGEDANLYWKQVVASNRKHMARIGLGDDEIEIQLQAFFDAVQSELVRLSYASHGHGGAA